MAAMTESIAKEIFNAIERYCESIGASKRYYKYHFTKPSRYVKKGYVYLRISHTFCLPDYSHPDIHLEKFLNGLVKIPRHHIDVLADSGTQSMNYEIYMNYGRK